MSELKPTISLRHPGSTGSRSSAARWLGPLVVIVSTVAMVVWTWMCWPDPIVDFGSQLYTPWQITQGQQLYVDIAYTNGPLSPHLNAIWFGLYGVGLHTLVIANLAIIAILLLVLYRLGAIIGGHAAATLACLAFVGLFGFAQYATTHNTIGSFNWVCPGSHELTHGIVLSFLAVYCLWLYGNRHKVRWLAVSGLATGLAFLTTAHVSGPAIAGVGLGLLAMLWVDRYAFGKAMRRVGVWLLAALVPPAIAWALLSISMNPDDALKAVVGSWYYAFGLANTFDSPFLRNGFGLDNVQTNTLAALEWFCRCVAVLGPATILATFGRTIDRPRQWLVVLTALGLGLPVVLHWRGPWIWDLGRPLPLFMAIFLITTIVRLARRRAAGEPGRELIPRLAILLFAIFMLLRMLLNARMHGLGFALAMPATIVLAMLAASSPPRWIRGRGGYVPVYGAVLVIAFAVVVAAHLRATSQYMATKTHTVAADADAFRADHRGEAVNKAVSYIQAHTDETNTLAILPEGAMLNYLARRQAPTPYVDLTPHELSLHRLKPVINAFILNSPDMIVLVPRDTSDWGPGDFGRDYAQGLMGWVKAQYKSTETIGEPVVVRIYEPRD